MLQSALLSLGLAVLVLATHALSAQSNLQDQYRLHLIKTNEAIQIDGELSEEVWKHADVATDFWMSFPVDDRRVEAALQTEVMMTYDDTYLYIAAICHGPGPYVIQSLKRDNPNFWMGDAFSVVIDPVNERQAAFSFGTNPLSIQIESLVSGLTGRRGGINANTGINVAWDNRWFCRSKVYDDRWTLEMAIPFKTLRYRDKGIWGINFIRGDAKSNSFHTWAPVPVQFRGVDLGYTGSLHWDAPPQKSRSNIAVIPYALASAAHDHRSDSKTSGATQIGLDAKVAVTSSLNLDLTVNPDFSQVDVDEQVTNLSTVNLRFPEQRLFFLENSDLFEDFGIPPMRPFFSRRIGIDDNRNSIPIAFGARLSGNLNKDLRVGAMTVQTKTTEAFKGQNYSTLAFQQRLFGRTVTKGYFNNRQDFSAPNGGGPDFNRTAGLEFEYRSVDGRWRSLGGYGKAFTPIKADQNYFYQVATGYDGRQFSFYTNLAGAGTNYVSDMGFLPRIFHIDAERDTMYRIGFDHWFSRMSYTLYPAGGKVNAHEWSFRNIMDVARDGRFISNDFSLNYVLLWKNTANLMASFFRVDAQLLYPFRFTRGLPLPADYYTYYYTRLDYRSDQRKFFTYSAGIELGEFYNGQRTQYMLRVNYRVQPWGNFGMNFVQNDLRFPEPYANGSLFLIGPRIEVNFSRDIFWTTFVQYNTQEDNLNINSRLQWRFAPVSDLFIVYTDNYAVELWGAKNKALVVKLNYWLNV